MSNNPPPLKKIGSLEILDFPLEGRPAFLLLHGYGADAYDLLPLKGELGGQFRWVFAQGPRAVEIGPGYFGRAWFPIDLTQDVISYEERRPRGVSEARDQVLSLIKNLNLAPENLVLGGFSQGAMLALDVALTLPGRVKALVLLSSTLADRENLKARAPHFKGQKFFQSHGRRDSILPFSGAERLHEELVKADWDGVWSPFAGAHEIPPSVVQDLKSFLKNNGL